MTPSAAQHIAACLALCERLEREPATQAELDKSWRELGLDQRWPPVQQELLTAA